MRISLAFAALLGALPFLFAEHRAPLPSFYDEWLGAALGTLAVTAFLLGKPSGESALPDLTVWLVLFAAWLGLQALLRPPAYAQLPLAGIAYVLLAAQLAWLGRALADRHGAERVADVLAWAILAGAGVNAAIGIVQFYGVPRVLGEFIATSAGSRVVGHVGQANLLADYVALGQASLLYLVARERIRGGWWWGVAALLVLASACAQSRSAILFSLWIGAAAFCLRDQGPQWRRLARQAGVLAAATLAAMVAIPRLHGTAERLLDAQLILAEPRTALWALAWRLFAESPWLGVGWGEFAGAAFSAGLPHAGVWTSPHNLFLQLAAEAGLIGAALILVAALRWSRGAWRDLRSAATLPLWWVAAVAGTIGLHALLEYPLWYAHVLGLAAFVAGIASRTRFTVPAAPLRGGLAAMSAVAFALLAWTLVDYQRFDRACVIAGGRTLAAPAEVSAAVDELRAVARGPLGAQVAPWLYQSLPPGEVSVDMGERVLRRWPSPLVVARHAAALASARRGVPPPSR
ncbi:MAG TPA: Wzy polymerase domain-containing protein [Burkholderiales bacterium]|nr:Wzy polymerase domain-containing protein [Burkholderiales bacterium]